MNGSFLFASHMEVSENVGYCSEVKGGDEEEELDRGPSDVDLAVIPPSAVPAMVLLELP